MSGRSLGRAGGYLGLGISLLLAARLVQVQSEPGREGPLYGLAFGVLYVAPFAVALAALALRDPNRRIAVWVGIAMLSGLLSFTSFAAVTLPLLAPAVLLFAGALRTHREERCRMRLSLVGLTATFILIGAGAFAVLWWGAVAAPVSLLLWGCGGVVMAGLLAGDRREALGVKP